MHLPDPNNFDHSLIDRASCDHNSSEDAKVLLNIVSEIEALDAGLETFRYEPYRKEALEIAPMWLYQEASPRATDLFKKTTAWDDQNKTMIFLIRDYDGRLISYKRRRYRNGMIQDILTLPLSLKKI